MHRFLKQCSNCELISALVFAIIQKSGYEV